MFVMLLSRRGKALLEHQNKNIWSRGKALLEHQNRYKHSENDVCLPFRCRHTSTHRLVKTATTLSYLALSCFTRRVLVVQKTKISVDNAVAERAPLARWV